MSAITWKHAASGNWLNPGGWTSTAVPDRADDVVLTSAATNAGVVDAEALATR